MNKTNYYLVVNPKYDYFKDLIDSKDESDRVLLQFYIERNNKQRELIRDIIETECVAQPVIESCWVSQTMEERTFSMCPLKVYYPDDSTLSSKDRLTALRYIGEELLPWVEEVKLVKW